MDRKILKRATQLLFIGLMIMSLKVNAQVFCEDIIGFNCDSCPNYTVSSNPDLGANCENSMNMILLIDESNSIWISGVEEEVAEGVNAFLGELACSSINISIIEFGSTANYVVDSYTPVADVVQGMADYFNGIPYNEQIYAPNGAGLGGTNWQASLLQANLLPTADLVLMLTDGIPTAYTPDATLPELSYDFCGSGTSTQQAEIFNTVQMANVIKEAGSHMFVMGVGNVNTDYIADISGADVFGDENTIATADYFFDEGFGTFVENFSLLANSICPIIVNTEGTLICEGSSNGAIFVEFSPNANGPFSVSVNGNAPIITEDYSLSIGNLEVGTYAVQVDGADGCFGTGTASIEVYGILLPSLEVQDIALCEGFDGSVDLNTLIASDGSVTVYSTPEDADSGDAPLEDLVVSPTVTTTYYVRSETSTGFCFATASLTITISPLPTCTVEDAIIDCSSSEGAITLNASSETEDVSFSWSTIDGYIVSGADSSSPLVNEAGVYIVTVTDLITGCSSTCQATVTVDIETPIVSLASVSDLCLGHDPVQLIGQPSGGTFSGNNVSPQGLFTSNTTGSYDISYTYVSPVNGCESTATISIQVVDCCEEETAFAYSPAVSTCFSESNLNNNSRWGWSNGPLSFDTDYSFELIAGAGQCVVENGANVGDVSLSYTATGDLLVTYSLEAVDLPAYYQLGTLHVSIGCEQFPESLAPGQFPYHTSPEDALTASLIIPAQDLVTLGCDQFYFIAHAEVALCNVGVILNSEDLTETPPSSSVLMVYPMPFKDTFTVRYRYTYSTRVRLDVVDIHGRLVTSLDDTNYKEGTLVEQRMQLKNRSKGLLFLKVTTERETYIKKLLTR